MHDFRARLARMSPNRADYLLRGAIKNLSNGYGAQWQEAARFVTNLAYVEVMSERGLIQEAIEDYAIIKNALRVGSRRHSESALAGYVAALMEYSEAPHRRNLPPAPRSVLVEAAPPDSPTASPKSAAEIVRAWEHFVSNNAAALTRAESPVFQLAWNWANSGPVGEAATTHARRETDSGRLWIRLISRKHYLADSALVRTLEPEGVPPAFFQRICLSRNGRLAFCGDSEGRITVWDVRSGACQQSFTAHAGPIGALALSPDGRWLVSYGRDGRIRLWLSAEGRTICDIPRVGDRIHDIAITLDGSCVIAVDASGLIRVWALKKQRLLRSLRSGIFSCLRVSACSRWFLAGEATGGKVCKVDAQSGQIIWKADVHEDSVSALDMTPDGNWAISGSFDHTVAFWDVNRGECLARFGGHEGWVNGVAISLDGRMGASSGGEGKVAIWDFAQRRLHKLLAGHSGMVNAVALSGDAGTAVSGGYDGRICVWDTLGDTTARKQHDASAIVYSAPGFDAIVCQGRDRSVSIASPSQDGDPHMLTLSDGRVLEPDCVAASAAHASIITGYERGMIGLWDIASGILRSRWQGYDKPVAHLEVMPDDKTLLSVDESGELRLWDIDTHVQLAHSVLGPQAQYLATSRDGSQIAFGGSDRTLRVFNAAADGIIQLWEGPSNYYGVGRFSCVSGRLYCQTVEGDLVLVDVMSGQCLWSQRNVDCLLPVLEVPSTEWLLAGVGATIVILDRNSGEVRGSLWGHRGRILKVLPSADGHYLMSSASDHTCRLWDLQNGKCLSVCVSAPAEFRPQAFAWPFVLLESSIGPPLFMKIENAPELDVPVVLPVKVWWHGHGWEDQFTARCCWCGRRFPVPPRRFSVLTHCPLPECGRPLRLAAGAYGGAFV